MSERRIVLALLALPLVARRRARRAAGRMREPRARAPGRQQLESRLRQRLWSITKNRVGFTDQQMTKLAQTSRGFDQRRRQLAIEEREQRAAHAARDPRRFRRRPDAVATALDRVLQIQRERIDLQIAGAARLRRVHDPGAAGQIRCAPGAAAPPSGKAPGPARRCGLDARRGRPALTSSPIALVWPPSTVERSGEYSDRPLRSIDWWGSCPGGGIGRRRGLKIPHPSGIYEFESRPGYAIDNDWDTTRNREQTICSRFHRLVVIFCQCPRPILKERSFSCRVPGAC